MLINRHVRVALSMKYLFKSSVFSVFFLALSCLVYFQIAFAQDKVTKQNHPFAISATVSYASSDRAITDFYKSLNSSKDYAMKEKHVSFLPNSGLYSGFGTAWHRSYGSVFETINTLSSEPEIHEIHEIHCDFFIAGFEAIDEFEFVSSNVETQLLFSYRNSF